MLNCVIFVTAEDVEQLRQQGGHIRSRFSAGRNTLSVQNRTRTKSVVSGHETRSSDITQQVYPALSLSGDVY